MRSDLVACTSMICMALGLVSAHQHGINGTVTTVIIAAIAGIGGYQYARS